MSEQPKDSEPTFGAVARLDAMLAGEPEFWKVTRWPVSHDEFERLEAELNEPPKVIDPLLDLAKKHRA